MGAADSDHPVPLMGQAGARPPGPADRGRLRPALQGPPSAKASPRQVPTQSDIQIHGKLVFSFPGLDWPSGGAVIPAAGNRHVTQ
jgi:hypothetical protein